MEVWLVNLAYREHWRTLPIGKRDLSLLSTLCSNLMADLQLCIVSMLVPLAAVKQNGRQLCSACLSPGALLAMLISVFSTLPTHPLNF